MKKEDKFSALIDNINALAREIQTCKADRAYKIKKFQEYLDENQVLTEKIQKAFEKEMQKVIPIKLSDLVKELCDITNTDISKLNIKITTNMFLSKLSYDSASDLDQEKLSRRINTNLEVNIQDETNKSSGINICMYFPFDFSDKLANGTTLFDACGLNSLKNDFEIVIDKNIGDYICNFSLDRILNGTQAPKCQPSGVLQQAIKNCYNNNKLHSKEKSITEEQEK